MTQTCLPSTIEPCGGSSGPPGSGDIEGVIAGAGLSGGGTSGTVTLSIPTGGVTGAMLLDGTITNADVSAVAAIAESKLALNSPTHTSVNDPTADQKAALAGTSGTPSGANAYVTNADTRNTNSRVPTGAAGGGLAGNYPNPVIAPGVVTGAMVAAGTLDTTDLSATAGITAGQIAPNIVSSVDGVDNDGGNIDLIQGAGITITPNNTLKTITVAKTGVVTGRVVATGNLLTTGITAATAIDYISFTLPSANTWAVHYTLFAGNSALANKGVAGVITNLANVVIANTEVGAIYVTGLSAGVASSVSGFIFITTTGAETFKLRIYGITAAGSFAISNSDGRSAVSFFSLN